MQYGKLRTNTDCHEWCRIVSLANPASSSWMCDLGIRYSEWISVTTFLASWSHPTTRLVPRDLRFDIQLLQSVRCDFKPWLHLGCCWNEKQRTRVYNCSVVECLTRDRGFADSSLIGLNVLCPWARHTNSCLVLVCIRKTRTDITETSLAATKQTSKNALSPQTHKC